MGRFFAGLRELVGAIVLVLVDFLVFSALLAALAWGIHAVA